MTVQAAFHTVDGREIASPTATRYVWRVRITKVAGGHGNAQCGGSCSGA